MIVVALVVSASPHASGGPEEVASWARDRVDETQNRALWEVMDHARGHVRYIHQTVINVLAGTTDLVYYVDPYDTTGNSTPLLAVLVENLAEEGTFDLLSPANQVVQTTKTVYPATPVDAPDGMRALFLDVIPLPGVWSVLNEGKLVARFTIEQTRNVPIPDAQQRVFDLPAEWFDESGNQVYPEDMPTSQDSLDPIGFQCDPAIRPDMTNGAGWEQGSARTGAASNNAAAWNFAGFEMTYYKKEADPIAYTCLEKPVYKKHVGTASLIVAGPTHPVQLGDYEAHIFTAGMQEKGPCGVRHRDGRTVCRVRELIVSHPRVHVLDEPNGDQHVPGDLAWVAGSHGTRDPVKGFAKQAFEMVLGRINAKVYAAYKAAEMLYEIFGLKWWNCADEPACVTFLESSKSEVSHGVESIVRFENERYNVMNVRGEAVLIWYDYYEWFENGRNQRQYIMNRAYRTSYDAFTTICNGWSPECMFF